jgi:hypothetical protein
MKIELELFDPKEKLPEPNHRVIAFCDWGITEAWIASDELSQNWNCPTRETWVYNAPVSGFEEHLEDVWYWAEKPNIKSAT